MPAGNDTEIWDVGGIGGAKSLDLELERNSPRLGLPLRQCETQVGREQVFRKITVAFDESEEAGRALQAAVELARSLDASLNVISVIEPPPIYFSFSTLVAPYIRWTDEMETRYTNLQSKAASWQKMPDWLSMPPFRMEMKLAAFSQLQFTMSVTFLSSVCPNTLG